MTDKTKTCPTCGGGEAARFCSACMGEGVRLISSHNENERIALRREWVYTKEDTFPWRGQLKSEPHALTHLSPPDYLNEWEHAGPLFVELLVKYTSVIFTDYGEDGWGCECFEVDDERGIDVLVIERDGPTVETAAARAWFASEEAGR